jgi:6-phosphogluconate dehydrogenase
MGASEPKKEAKPPAAQPQPQPQRIMEEKPKKHEKKETEESIEDVSSQFGTIPLTMSFEEKVQVLEDREKSVDFGQELENLEELFKSGFIVENDYLQRKNEVTMQRYSLENLGPPHLSFVRIT